MAPGTCIATRVERRRPLAVDAMVPDPIFTSTHAITIDTPPERVWPWIVQMGGGLARSESEWIGTLLIYNGSIAFAMTGLFLGSAAWGTFDSRVLPRWTGWIAVASAVLCAASVAAMYGGPVNYTGFYNAGGWGPAIVANLPPMIWFLTVSVVLIRRPGIGHGVIVRAA